MLIGGADDYYDNDPEESGSGAIIGEVDITNCVDKSDSPWFVGKYGLVLANPVLYDKPIPYRGQLGFFEVKLTTPYPRRVRLRERGGSE